LLPKLKTLIALYFKDRIFLVALVLILFVMGIIFGVLAARLMGFDQKADLIKYVTQGLHETTIVQNNAYTKQTIIANIQTVFFLFFMGISVIGIPLALLLIFTRGFILGFCMGFLLQNMGLKGAVVVMAGIVPHNLLIIPGLLLMVVAMIDCATALAKIRFTKRQVPIGEELIRSAVLTLIVLVVMIVAGLVQGYLTPALTGWVGRLI